MMPDHESSNTNECGNIDSNNPDLKLMLLLSNTLHTLRVCLRQGYFQ